MQPIKEPREKDDYAERALDCREAIGAKVQQVTEAAMHAGWSRDEIKAAFIDIAERWQTTDHIV
ncbi:MULTISPECIES: hypothetical protein [unclassified Rhizobium]|uniref:hypothetical protein n=1 Tax=unclassified Rhizobium TaxID=2613769 RepID=UPI000A67E08E|nr:MULTISPECIES: hypothetical protein [unclassified Rhizobium]TCM58246.1 hypothetical protein C8J36_101146 [Rhizobium sp. PP-F2F-G48]